MDTETKKSNLHIYVLYTIICILVIIIYKDKQVKYPLDNNIAHKVKYNEQDQKNRELTIQNAKLIVYGKSYIKGGKHITMFDKVLWGDKNHSNNEILNSFSIEKNTSYGDALILFYDDNNMNNSPEYWAVYNGRIPSWGNQDITELINYLKNKK